MDTNARIRALCKEKGVTIQRLEIELGEKPSSISKTTSNSKAEKLYKIARYFGVSVDYLISGESPAAFVLSDTEKQIVEAYRRMSPELKTALYGFLGIKGDADVSEMAGRSTGTAD